jgi:hypothetical protein
VREKACTTRAALEGNGAHIEDRHAAVEERRTGARRLREHALIQRPQAALPPGESSRVVLRTRSTRVLAPGGQRNGERVLLESAVWSFSLRVRSSLAVTS